MDNLFLILTLNGHTLNFNSSIQLHYEKLNSVNESDIHLFDEEDLIKLSLEYM